MDTKEQILKKARKLFAKHGFDGVSIRSICEKASCNVSAISYHYGSKEELYRACLEEDGSNVIQMIETILSPIENAADFKVKIKIAMVQFFEYSVNNRDLILMISKDVNSKMAIETIHRIFHRLPEKLTEFFQEAIDKDIIRKEIDPSFLADFIIQPYFVSTLFSESNKILKQKNISDATYRLQFIDQQFEVLFAGILKN